MNKENIVESVKSTNNIEEFEDCTSHKSYKFSEESIPPTPNITEMGLFQDKKTKRSADEINSKTYMLLSKEENLFDADLIKSDNCEMQVTSNNLSDMEIEMLNNFVNEVEVSVENEDTISSKKILDVNIIDNEQNADVFYNDNGSENCDNENIPCKHSLSIEKYMHDDDAVHFYTGLESYEKFLFVFRSLAPGVNHLKYYYGKTPTDITVINRFFLTLIVLRERKTYYELSLMFNTTKKQVSNIFVTWIRFMRLQWSEISQWPEKDLVQFYAPRDFKKKFPSVRITLDATEIPIKKPSKPTAQQSTFSKYKNKNTVKVVVGSTPGGLISYISPAYGGSATDRQIIERSDLLKKLEPGDSVMVDKGFDIEDLLACYRVTLNIPTFFKKQNQIAPETLRKDRKISSKRGILRSILV